MNTIDWLIGSGDPAVAYRTKTEILKENADKEDVRGFIISKLPDNWHETKGLWYVYYLTALAESGLDKDDIEEFRVSPAFERLRGSADSGCEILMLLRALVKLGYTDNEDVIAALRTLSDSPCSDGGYLCSRRLKKLEYIPKSCYKANLHALLLLSECRKKGIDLLPEEKIVSYFTSREIFYKRALKKNLLSRINPVGGPLIPFSRLSRCVSDFKMLSKRSAHSDMETIQRFRRRGRCWTLSRMRKEGAS